MAEREVIVEGRGRFMFPAEMSDEEIDGIFRREFPAWFDKPPTPTEQAQPARRARPATPPPEEDLSWYEYPAHAYSKFTESIVEGFTAIPEVIGLAEYNLYRKLGIDYDLDDSYFTKAAKTAKEVGAVGSGTRSFTSPVRTMEREQLQDSFWASDVPAGLGSVVGYATGRKFVTEPLKQGFKHFGREVSKGVPQAQALRALPGTAQQTVRGATIDMAGSLSQSVAMGQTEAWADAYGTLMDKARAEGRTQLNDGELDTAFQAMMWGTGSGLTEMYGANRIALKLFKRLDRTTGGAWGKGLLHVVKETAKGGAEEAAQEMIQNSWLNFTASHLAKYDENRKLADGVVRSGEVGGTVGAIFGLMLGARRMRAGRRDRVVAKIEERTGKPITPELLAAVEEDLAASDITPKQLEFMLAGVTGEEVSAAPETAAPALGVSPTTDQQRVVMGHVEGESKKVAGAENVVVSEGGKGQAAIYAKRDLSDEIHVDPVKLEDATSDLTPAQKKTYVRMAIEEEVAHNGTIAVKHEEWTKKFAGKKGAPEFWGWYNSEMALLAAEITPEQAAKVKKGYGKEDMTDTQLAEEYMRRLLQEERTGSSTESVWQEVGKLDNPLTRNWFKKVINFLTGKHGKTKLTRSLLTRLHRVHDKLDKKAKAGKKTREAVPVKAEKVVAPVESETERERAEAREYLKRIKKDPLKLHLEDIRMERAKELEAQEVPKPTDSAGKRDKVETVTPEGAPAYTPEQIHEKALKVLARRTSGLEAGEASRVEAIAMRRLESMLTGGKPVPKAHVNKKIKQAIDDGLKGRTRTERDTRLEGETAGEPVAVESPVAAAEKADVAGLNIRGRAKRIMSKLKGRPKNYVNDLVSVMEGEQTQAELADVHGLRKDTVSRDMKRLQTGLKAELEAEGVTKPSDIISAPVPKKKQGEVVVTEEGSAFNGKQSGESVTFDFIRNTERADDFGPTYGQDKEPSGRYLSENTTNFSAPPGWETGTVTLESPLLIDWGNRDKGYAHPENWKNVLSEEYGARGAALSRKIVKAGYDGVVTVDRNGYPSEIVDLSKFAGKGADIISAPVPRKAKKKGSVSESIEAAALPENLVEAAVAVSKAENTDSTSTLEEFFGKVWPRLLRSVGRQEVSKKDPAILAAVDRSISDMQEFIRDNPRYVDFYNKDWKLTRKYLNEFVQEKFGRDISDGEFLMFRIASGLNSPNTKLEVNLADAVNWLNHWLTEGNFDGFKMGLSAKGNPVATSKAFTVSGTTLNIKIRSMLVFERLIKKFDGDVGKAVDYLRESVTPKELNAFNREMGYKGNISKVGNIKRLVKAATGQDELIPRMFIFGEKIGAYTLNSVGDSEFSTIDIWEARLIRSHFRGMFKENYGLPVNTDEHRLFSRYTEIFHERFEEITGRKWEKSALQAIRWFYFIDSAKRARYTPAKTDETISGYTKQKLDRLRGLDQESRGRGDETTGRGDGGRDVRQRGAPESSQRGRVKGEDLIISAPTPRKGKTRADLATEAREAVKNRAEGKTEQEALIEWSDTLSNDEMILFRYGTEGDTDLGPDETKKRLSATKTIAETIATEPVAEELRAFDDAYYDPIKNDETMAEAEAFVEQHGATEAELIVGDSTRQASALDTAVRIVLIGKHQQAGNHEKAVVVAFNAAERAKEQGQAIQVLSILRRLSPEGALIYATRIAQTAKKNAPNEAAKAVIDKNLAEKARPIREKAEKLREMEEAAEQKSGAVEATKAELEEANKVLEEAQAELKEARAELRAARSAKGEGLGPGKGEGRGEGLGSGKGEGKGEGLGSGKGEGKGKGKGEPDQGELFTEPTRKRRRQSTKEEQLELIAEEEVAKVKVRKKLTEAQKAERKAERAKEKAEKAEAAIQEKHSQVEDANRLIAAAELMDEIHSVVPVDLWEKVKIIQTMAMLLNPKTALRNIGGNIILFGVNIPVEFLEIPMDWGISFVTGRRTTALEGMFKDRWKGLKQPVGEVKEWYAAAQAEGKSKKESIKEAVSNLIKVSRMIAQQKYEMSDISRMGSRVFDSKGMRMLEDLLAFELSVIDRQFWLAAYHREIGIQLKTRDIVVPDRKAIETATFEANYAIYQDENKLSNALQATRSMFNRILGGGGKKVGAQRQGGWGLGDALIKFTQVPGSILMRGLEFSPAGFFNAMYQGGYQPLVNDKFDQRAFTKAFSRATVGSGGLVGVGAWLFAMGIITAADDEDRKLRELNRERGIMKYSVNVSALKRLLLTWKKQTHQRGDLQFSYDWAQPLATPVAIGAGMWQEHERINRDIKNNNTTSVPSAVVQMWHMGGKGIKSASRTIEEQPIFSGLQQGMRGYHYADRDEGKMYSAIAAVAENVPRTFVPTITKQLAQVGDSTIRERRASDMVTRVVNGIGADLGMDVVPEKPGLYGQTIRKYESDSVANRLFLSLFSPANVRTIKNDPVLDEVFRLYQVTGETGHWPIRKSIKITVNGKKRVLSPQEVTDYQHLIGEKSHAETLRIIRLPGYKNWSESAKQSAIQRVVRDSAQAARILLFQQHTRSTSERARLWAYKMKRQAEK